MKEVKKMNPRTGLISVICGVALSTSALAAGWSTEQPITEVRFYEDGAIQLDGAIGWLNRPACLDYGNYIVIDPAHPFYSEMYATVMAAYLQNRNIMAYQSGCYTTLDGKNYPSVTRLLVR